MTVEFVAVLGSEETHYCDRLDVSLESLEPLKLVDEAVEGPCPRRGVSCVVLLTVVKSNDR